MVDMRNKGAVCPLRTPPPFGGTFLITKDNRTIAPQGGGGYGGQAAPQKIDYETNSTTL